MVIPRLNERDARAARIVRELGFKRPRRTVLAARKAGCPLSYALATVRMESTNGSNVFGHDGTSSIPNRWKGKRVTLWRYKYYKRRRLTKGAQGVGPVQLTYPGFQDMADKEGGCWRAYPSMVVGFSVIKNLIDTHGKQVGASKYNGTGPEAEAYARSWIAFQKQFHRRLVEHG